MSLRNEVSLNLGLPVATAVQDPELAIELNRLYNAIKILARGMDLNTGALGEEDKYWAETGSQRCTFGNNAVLYLEAGEDLAYASLVGIKNDGKAWKADDGVLPCIGFCNVKAGTTAGDFTEVRCLGIYPPLPAATLTPGNFYYLSSTAGVIGNFASAPAYRQVVGFAVSDTVLFFTPQF
jgi:hypothetical protein